jgi:hypothetical protein
MEDILKALSNYFDNKIKFPERLRKKGVIDDDTTGWYIRYIVSKNEQGEIYLDFTADHRMTNSRHHRIAANGDVTFLEMYEDFFSYDPKIPGDEEVKRQEYYKHNRNVSRILIKKGLMDLKGNEYLFDSDLDN